MLCSYCFNDQLFNQETDHEMIFEFTKPILFMNKKQVGKPLDVGLIYYSPMVFDVLILQ